MFLLLPTKIIDEVFAKNLLLLHQLSNRMQILVPNCLSKLLYNLSRNQSRNLLISSSSVAYFRSTPASSEKWKDKWFNSSAFGDAKPTKPYTRYKTRQKRADAKKALNDIFFGSGSSKFTLEGEFSKKGRKKSWDGDPEEDRKKRDPSARCARKEHKKRKRNKSRKANLFEEFDDDDYDDLRTHFQAMFGNRRYSWSFKSWEESFSQSKTSGFEYSNTRNKWRTVSDDESTEDDDPYVVGSHSDRLTLGLPMNGPLKIEEVKNAFRLSALKWHPDKHQGPSQALAAEKFKVCVGAYKSLCDALSQV